MKMRLIFPFVLLIYSLICQADGGKDSYIFRKVDYQQGLSNSAVLCLFQDNTGLMWFGTYDGVNCYDGRSMEVFRSDFSAPKALSNNVIHSIQQADNNCLWISTHLGINRLSQDSRLTCEFLNLQIGDTALLCMNLRYIGAMMVVVRSLVAGLNLIIRPASGHPLADMKQPLRFAAMVPLQVYNTLQVPEEKERLRQTDVLIIGGGAIDETLEAEIRNLPGAIYSTYGMTETLSHIALRRLNGVLASERYYPFASVELSLSSENTLVIKAPLVCDDILQTNDIAHIYPDGSFTILGRKDNVINSGGIKIQAEEIEKILRPYIPVPFVITSVPDQRLGQAVTLLLEGQPDIKEIEDKLQSILEPYHRPKYVLYTDCIPQTGNGKMNRAGCRDLAERLLS